MTFCRVPKKRYSGPLQPRERERERERERDVFHRVCVAQACADTYLVMAYLQGCRVPQWVPGMPVDPRTPANNVRMELTWLSNYEGAPQVVGEYYLTREERNQRPVWRKVVPFSA